MNGDYNIEQRCPEGSFSYTIRSGDTLYALAQRYNTTVRAIEDLNPNIDPADLRVGQMICIPGMMPECRNGFFYVIRPGDTLYRLGQRFGVSVDAILRANPGIDPDRLRIGQRICIPSADQPLPPCENGVYYTIRSGDTLYALAQRFNVSVASIISANPGIDPNNLRVGQTICIPRAVTPTPPCQNGFYYSIRQGDTLYMIGQRYNVSVDAIIEANPGIDPNMLRIGQIICIPTF